MDIDQIKSALDERDGAIAKKLNAVEKENEALRERIEEIESKENRPGKPMRDNEHMRLFTAWLRKPHDEKSRTELGNYQSDLERKDVTIASLPGGGYSVPEEIVREIERIEMKFSPVRGLVKVIRIGSGDAKQLVNTRHRCRVGR